ncbi:MAG: hypothetical protein A2Y95_03810 [Deltaproteobacteria bacterium RBG_13_65_10]|nr:MAG: hypothetical protein A2Y95_03810 [Deltaproteobacteria bacterium RBG_13_65_10]
MPGRWSITFGPEVCRDLPLASSKEWIETNGLGGFAMGTVSGLLTRRYHGLLVASLRPPTSRHVFLSTLQERLETAEGAWDLGCLRYPGTIHPDGYKRLERFELKPCPTWEYRGPGFALRKMVAMVPGTDTTLIAYMLLPGSGAARLNIRPLLAFRDFHTLSHTNVDAILQGGAGEGFVRFRPYATMPALTIAHTAGTWGGEAWWNYRVQYGFEEKRGLDCEEDLLSPGEISLTLSPGEVVSLAASLSPITPRDAERFWERELDRRTCPSDAPPDASPLLSALWETADQFLVGRGPRGRSFIAGYPWFTDRGRDSMIALRGLCLARGRLVEARGILETFADAMSEGMVPDYFPEGGEPPSYNAVDPSLWFVLAARAYLAASKDLGFVQGVLLQRIEAVIRAYMVGTRSGIRAEADGLLRQGSPGTQLTWMDAKVGEWVVTPRQGKAVEVNALWVNALRTCEVIAARAGRADLAAWTGKAARRAVAAFRNVFWNEAQRCLYDVVDGDRTDATLRPNQILALALPYRLLDEEKERAVLETVSASLLTPFGLRSLASSEAQYRGRYQGDVSARDSAYHQGTVWPWWLGAYGDALLRVEGDTPSTHSKVRDLFQAFEGHLGEIGLGTISEVFDGDAPHRPGGCISQAWSVSEILRVLMRVR